MSDEATKIYNAFREGQKALRENHPSMAIAKFSTAIDSLENMARSKGKASETLLKVLEYRMEANISIENLVEALHDAKLIVKWERRSSRGYLCVLSIFERDIYFRSLQIMDTYRLVKQGLGQIPRSDSKINELISKATQLRFLATKCKDPMKELPTDVLRIIFDYLFLESKVACLMVSKAWNSNMKSQAHYWRDLIISPSRFTKGGTLPLAKDILRYAEYAKLDIHKVWLRGKQTQVTRLLERCKITALRWFKGDFPITVTLRNDKLRSLVLSPANVSNVDVSLLLKEFANLEHLTIYSASTVRFENSGSSQNRSFVSGLRELCLLQCSQFGPRQVMEHLAMICPQLSNFRWVPLNHSVPGNDRIHAIPQVQNLQCFEIPHLRIYSNLPRTLQFLKVLNIGQQISIDHTVTSTNALLILPQLEYLEIGDCGAFRNAAEILSCFHIGDSLKTLRLLNINLMTPISEFDYVANFVAPFPSIEAVDFSGSSGIDDSTVNGILQHEKLNQADLSKTMISGVSVLKILNRGITRLSAEPRESPYPDETQRHYYRTAKKLRSWTPRTEFYRLS